MIQGSKGNFRRHLISKIWGQEISVAPKTIWEIVASLGYFMWEQTIWEFSKKVGIFKKKTIYFVVCGIENNEKLELIKISITENQMLYLCY